MPKLSRMSAYLYLRNRHLIWEAFEKTGIHVPVRQFRLMQLQLAFYFLRELLRNPATRNWTSVKAIWQGISDGRRGIYGPPPWLRPKP